MEAAELDVLHVTDLVSKRTHKDNNSPVALVKEPRWSTVSDASKAESSAMFASELK